MVPSSSDPTQRDPLRLLAHKMEMAHWWTWKSSVTDNVANVLRVDIAYNCKTMDLLVLFLRK